MNTLDEFAIGIQEIYESYIRAGFTPDQAFVLVQIHLASVLREVPR